MNSIFQNGLTLQNDKVLLRPVQSGDYHDFKKITDDPDLWYYFTTDLSESELLKQWVDIAMADWDAGRRMAFTIVERSTGKIAGSTSLGSFSDRDARAEIGWTWIGKSFQGKGINDQSKLLLMEYCFDTLGLERVEIKTDVLNHYARKALKRMGIIEEGILRSHTLVAHGRRRDTIYYSVLKSEWKGIRDRFLKND